MSEAATLTREQIEALLERLMTASKWAVAENDHIEPAMVEEAADALVQLNGLVWTEDGRLWKDVAEERKSSMDTLGRVAVLRIKELKDDLATERARREACEAALISIEADLRIDPWVRRFAATVVGQHSSARAALTPASEGKP